MRLLMNAVGCRAGGGLTVGLNCIRGIRQARPAYEIMALVPAGHGYEALCESLSIPYRAFPRTLGYAAWRLWFDQVQVPLAARQWSADVLFTMNNQPAWGAPCPQIALFANPYYISPVAEWPPVTLFERTSFLVQRHVFAASARRCAYIAAQTAVAATRLHDSFGIDRARLVIVPNAVASEHYDSETADGQRLAGRMHDAAAGRVRVLTVARYYSHKNLEMIVRLARRLRETGDRRFAFFITIAAEQHAGARALLDTIERHQLGDDIVNLGPLGYGELGSVYRAAQICFLPTVLESMSGSYLEAFHYRLPIVTTESDFARDTCGSAAAYFPPDDVDAAIQQLQAALLSPSRHDGGEVRAEPRRWADVCSDVAGVIDSIRPRDAATSRMRARVEVP
jgi:glycosyltransferase involved in cell wall biosynthesis